MLSNSHGMTGPDGRQRPDCWEPATGPRKGLGKYYEGRPGCHSWEDPNYTHKDGSHTRPACGFLHECQAAKRLLKAEADNKVHLPVTNQVTQPIRPFTPPTLSTSTTTPSQSPTTFVPSPIQLPAASYLPKPPPAPAPVSYVPQVHTTPQPQMSLEQMRQQALAAGYNEAAHQAQAMFNMMMQGFAHQMQNASSGVPGNQHHYGNGPSPTVKQFGGLLAQNEPWAENTYWKRLGSTMIRSGLIGILDAAAHHLSHNPFSSGFDPNKK